MGKSFLLLGLCVLYHVTFIAALGPKCYKCDHVVELKDCDHYEQCSENEHCYVQRYLGQQLNEFYRMGCMSNNVCSQSAFSLFGSFVGKRQTQVTAHAHAIEKSVSKREEDLLMCLQCCDGDYCNLHNALCGSLATQTNNLRCFECDDVADPTQCEKIVECQTNHHCLLHVYYRANSNSLRYDMGCQKDFVCAVINSTISSSSDHVSCAECCHDKNYCNFDLCKGIRPALNSNKTTPAPALSVNIPGTHTNNPYNGAVTLQCQATAGATIAWKKIGSNTLPAGVRVDSSTNTLIIDHVNENTIGNYTCIAALSITQIGAATSVVSISPQVPVITSFVASPQHPSTNSQVEITCKASGWPSDIQFTWELTNSATTNPPTQVSYRKVDHGQVMSIGQYDPKYHQGTYTCRAQNSAGTSQLSSLSLS